MVSIREVQNLNFFLFKIFINKISDYLEICVSLFFQPQHFCFVALTLNSLKFLKNSCTYATIVALHYTFCLYLIEPLDALLFNLTAASIFFKSNSHWSTVQLFYTIRALALLPSWRWVNQWPPVTKFMTNQWPTSTKLMP